MCLLITWACALIFAAVFFLKDRRNVFRTGTLALVFLSAGVMWLVDCTFAWYGGEEFLDLSADDALLGLTVAGAALLLWALLLLGERFKHSSRCGASGS